MNQPSRAAYAAADAVLSSKGRSFHWARRLLRPVHAERATRLYGFCRRVDDLADEAQSPELARASLHAIERSLQSGISNDPLVSDTLMLLQECEIDPAIPISLIHGVMSDLDEVQVTTVPDLLRYCYRVAGTVGLMMSAALDVHDVKASHHAIDLGIAMQLTNLCRDVQQDALAGRRYLPASLVGALEPNRLIRPSAEDRLIVSKTIETLLDLADIYYRSGEAGLGFLPANARSAMLVAVRVYQAIGHKLRARSFDYWTARVVVPTRDKAVISAQALLSWHVRHVIARPIGMHQQSLHVALAGLAGANHQTAYHAS